MAETDGDIIFGTKQLAEEGLDIPHLNTIVLATPEKNHKSLSQIIGRIMRKEAIENLNDLPLVIDISDMLSIYKAFSNNRDIYFKKQNFFVETYNFVDENYINNKNVDNIKDPINHVLNNIEDDDFIETLII